MDKVLVRIADSKPYELETLLNHKYLKEKDYPDILKYLNNEDKKERAVSIILRNKYIGKVSFSIRGKPLSKSKFFNISHSKGIVGLATTNNEVGLDIEVIRPVDKKLKDFVSNKDEKKYIKNDENFFEIWTNKESLLKCIGSGIRSKMDKVPSLPLNNIKFFDGQYFYCRTITYNNLVITVTRNSAEPFEIEVKEESI